MVKLDTVLILAAVGIGIAFLIPGIRKLGIQQAAAGSAEIQRAIFEGKTIQEVLAQPSSPITFTFPGQTQPTQITNPITGLPFRSTNQLGFFSPDGLTVALKNLRDNLTLGGTIFQ
jgi:hypothetical protein